MKKIVLLSVLLFSIVLFAKEENKTIQIQVKDKLCGFCVEGLKKKFGERREIANIDINLETQLITLSLKDGQTLKDEDISAILTDTGQEVATIKRK